MTVRTLLAARLNRSTVLSGDTKHLEFEVAGAGRFDFTAGQFISAVTTKPDGKELTRAYSIASPPRRDASFDLCLNRVQDGYMSNYLCDLEPGAQINLHGPHGLFTLREPLLDSIFIATGTGIAPFRGMVKWLFGEPARHQGREFWLVFGTRYQRDIYYRDEFEAIARAHANFHYIVTLSRDESWQGPRGYVQERVRELLDARPNQGREDMHAYICGLNLMVSANRELLKSVGWDRKHIIYERYD